jgi:enoyl-CoA hydratase/carnithine racemase
MESVRMEQTGAIARIVLDRPDRLNALTPEMIRELEGAIRQVESDRSVRAVVLTGAGRAFCAGVEVGKAEFNPLNSRVFLKDLNRVFDLLEAIPQPSLAVINGAAAAGGLELALACTFRLASTEARLGLPEVTLGLVASVGAMRRLPRLVGLGKAMEMCLLGEMMTACEALGCGLVNWVAEPGELGQCAEDLAARLAAGPPVAISLMKDAILAAADGGREAAALLEVLSAAVNHFTQDKKEGVAAFLGKRLPSFKGE